MPAEILFLQVGQPEVEVDKRKRGISLGGGLKFRQCGIVLLEVQVIRANKRRYSGEPSPSWMSCWVARLSSSLRPFAADAEALRCDGMAHPIPADRSKNKQCNSRA